MSNTAQLADLKKQLKAKHKELEELENRDWKAYAQSLIDKLFNDFRAGARWVANVKQQAQDHLYVISPSGRRRNLYGILTGINVIVAALLRRATNSPIQGFASEIAIKSARLVTLNFLDYMERFYPEELENTMFLPAEIEKFVHDALSSEPSYKHVLPYIHILQWTTTYGVSEYYRKHYGIDFVIEPEIELEIGASEDKMFKWDWTDTNLRQVLADALDKQKEIGQLKMSKEEALAEIYSAYDNPKLKRFLEKRYPILGVES